MSERAPPLWSGVHILRAHPRHGVGALVNARGWPGLAFSDMRPDPAFPAGVPQPIVGFHRDADGDWVAELRCGHTQHVRHEPPWQVREWVTTPEGRARALGTLLPCRRCLRDTGPR